MQSGKQRPLTQFSPDSQLAVVEHVVEGRQNELMQRSPARHWASDMQTRVHSLFTHD